MISLVVRGRESEHSVMPVFLPPVLENLNGELYGAGELTVLLAAYALVFSAALEQIVALAIHASCCLNGWNCRFSNLLTLMIRGMATGQVGLSNTKPICRERFQLA